MRKSHRLQARSRMLSLIAAATWCGARFSRPPARAPWRAIRTPSMKALSMSRRPDHYAQGA